MTHPDSTDNAPTCGDAGGRTKAGTPCRVTMNLGANGRCLQHDPERAERAREIRAQGGAAKGVATRKAKAALPEGVPSAPRTLEDAVRWSSWAARAIAVGEIDARTGHEVAYAINCFKAAVEKRDLQREIERLREELAAMRKQQRKSA